MVDEAPAADRLAKSEAMRPTPDQLADQFAKLAVEYALRPTTPGLDVLIDLMRKMKTP